MARNIELIVRDLYDNVHSMERNLLRLLANPDATAEHIMPAKVAYAAMLRDVQRVRAELNTRFPSAELNTRFPKPLQWKKFKSLSEGP